MNISNGQPVTGRFEAIDLDVDVETLRDTFGKYGTEFGNAPQDLLQLRTRLLNHFHVGALNLQTYRSLDARQLHVEPILHGHGPSVGQAGKLKLFVHLANELFVGHSRAPLLASFEHDRGVVHIQGSIVSRTVRAAHGTKDTLHFREGFYDSVLLLKKRRSLSDGDSGKGSWHVQRGTLIQRRHELTTNAPCEGKSDRQKDEVEQKCRFAVAQAEAENRQIKSLGPA